VLQGCHLQLGQEQGRHSAGQSAKEARHTLLFLSRVQCPKNTLIQRVQTKDFPCHGKDVWYVFQPHSHPRFQ
jgi:hypothetical protein